MVVRSNKVMKKCCVIGLGYIGLPTAAVLASKGNDVLGVDINPNIVDLINKGKIHIVEPGLDAIVKETVTCGSLRASKSPEASDVFLIAVPTPCADSINGIPQPSIEYVIQAAISIASVIKSGDLILLESTSPIGSTEKIAELISQISGLNLNQFYVSYSPERVFPGKVLYELVYNDRLIGGINKESADCGAKFYSTFCKGKIYKTNSKTAELAKLSENAFRDINIAFANELSMICKDLDIDDNELIKLVNCHPRVNVLEPSCGVGGHCIAIDPWFIASSFPTKTTLIQAARKVNNSKSKWVVDQIMIKIDELKNKLNRDINIGCLGLAYKPNIDDLRESPALEITTCLSNKGINIYACEPNLSVHATIKLYSLEETLEKSDLIVLLVAHKQFKKINFSRYDILDFCGLTKVDKIN